MAKRSDVDREFDAGNRPVETPGAMLKDGTIIDEIFRDESPAFIVWSDPARTPPGMSNYDIVDEWRDGERRLFPVKDDLLTKAKILLPSGICEYGSEEQLYAELLDYIIKYAEIDADLAPLLVLSIISTWLYEKIPVFPIICLRGASDTGKTRLGNVLWQIAFRGMRADGVLSLSSLFRNAERWHGTLYVNEGDIDESGRSEDSESRQKIKFYNARYERGGAVWRTEKNSLKSQVFDSFGPTIITTRKPFVDDALESRLFVFPMRGLTRTDIPFNLPDEFYAKGQELRNKLELFRLRNLARFKNDNSLKFEEISSRMNQILQPIASLSRAHLPKLYAEVQNLALKLSERVVEDRANSFDGQLVRAYVTVDPQLKGATPKQIADEMVNQFGIKDCDPRKVGKKARALGFSPFKSNDSKRSRLLKLERDFAKRLIRKYLPKDERDEYEEISRPSTQVKIDQTEKISKAVELFSRAVPIEEIKQIVGPEIVDHCLSKGILPMVGGRE
ncbi:MAG: hypothetical protein ACUVT7_09225 [Thermoplasmata archaeon]